MKYVKGGKSRGELIKGLDSDKVFVLPSVKRGRYWVFVVIISSSLNLRKDLFLSSLCWLHSWQAWEKMAWRRPKIIANRDAWGPKVNFCTRYLADPMLNFPIHRFLGLWHHSGCHNFLLTVGSTPEDFVCP